MYNSTSFFSDYGDMIFRLRRELSLDLRARADFVPTRGHRLRERSAGRQRGDEPEPARLRRGRLLLAGAVLPRRALQGRPSRKLSMVRALRFQHSLAVFEEI